MRWYASWVLIAAFLPLVACYSLWIYYTCTGQVRSRGPAPPLLRVSALTLTRPPPNP